MSKLVSFHKLIVAIVKAIKEAYAKWKIEN